MNPFIPSNEGMGEKRSQAKYRLALRAEVEVSNREELLWELIEYRYNMQKLVDELWSLKEVPGKSQLHAMFYERLAKERGYRAHVTKNMYIKAGKIVKEAIKNGASHVPILKRLTAEFDNYDARVDLERGEVKVIFKSKGKWFTIRLKHKKEYINKFQKQMLERKYKWKEVYVSYRNGKFYVSVVFEVEYKPYTPLSVIGLDVNLRKIVFYDGKKVRRVDTPFVKALSLRAKAEEIQKKYPKRWRHNKRILERIRELHRKAKNVVTDKSRKFAKRLVLFALKKKYAIKLEELTGLIEEMNNTSKKTRWKLSRLDYRILQNAIITKAIEYGVPLYFVEPKGTSKLCYRCGAELIYEGRLGICPKCRFIADRDKNAAMNIYKRMWGSLGSLLNAPAVKDETRQSGGKKMRG